ncbi:MAG: gliding motility protein GldN [Cyclobacteriaceae bacterium]
MKHFIKILTFGIGVAIISFAATTSLKAQESDGYNPNSIRPIHETDQLYKTRVWRRMDLKEKQNQPFFSTNREITKVLIQAVMNGTLYPYTSDSLNQRMSKEQFIENLTIPTDGPALSEDEIAMGFGQPQEEEKEDDGWGGGWGDSESEGDGAEGTASTASDSEDTGASSATDNLFFATDVTILEIMEDIIFDKRRGRQYYDIQSVKMVLPPEMFPTTGLQKEVATFKYMDLVRVFEENPEIAVWVNPQNDAKHLNLKHAFDLRLFSAHIVKHSNPENDYIIDKVDGDRRKALLQSLEYEYNLLEREHELWEY